MRQQIKAYLDGLNERERRLVYGGAVVALLILGHQFIWSPFVKGLSGMQTKVSQQQQDIVWMQNNMNEFRDLSRLASSSAGGGKSLYGVIESTARSKFGNKIQIAQEGQKGIRIVITNVAFDDVMLWLDTLNVQHQAVIKEFSAETTATAGFVKSTILVEG